MKFAKVHDGWFFELRLSVNTSDLLTPVNINCMPEACSAELALMSGRWIFSFLPISSICWSDLCLREYQSSLFFKNFSGDNSRTVDDCQSFVHTSQYPSVLLHLTVGDQPVDGHASPNWVLPFPHTGARAHQIHQSAGTPGTSGRLRLVQWGVCVGRKADG